MNYFFIILVFILGAFFIYVGKEMRAGNKNIWFIKIKKGTKKDLKYAGVSVLVCGFFLILIGFMMIFA